MRELGEGTVGFLECGASPYGFEAGHFYLADPFARDAGTAADGLEGLALCGSAEAEAADEDVSRAFGDSGKEALYEDGGVERERGGAGSCRLSGGYFHRRFHVA